MEDAIHDEIKNMFEELEEENHCGYYTVKDQKSFKGATYTELLYEGYID